MSKNTERGIGQQVGTAADGRPDDTRPRHASETSTVGPAPDGPDRDRAGRAPKVEVAQITLLGVAAPDLDREKATTPGRDVHLPTEARRVAAPRAVAADAPSLSPARDRRKTPERPRSRVTSSSASSIAVDTQDVMSTVNARLSETAEVPNGGLRVARRRDFAETTLMDAVPETGRGGPIALGIAISLVAAAVVVWTLRFGPHLRGFEAAVAERRSPPSELGRMRTGSSLDEAHLPAPRGVTPPAAESEPSIPGAAAGPAARGFPPPEETAAARGTPVDDGASAAREGSEAAPRFGSPPSAPGATEEDGRRKNQRARTSPSAERNGDRNGSWPLAPKRTPPPPIFRGSDAPGQLPTSSPPPPGAGRAVTSEPPRFEPPPPPPPPPAASPSRPANEKPLYDPDSPLPPAAGE